MLLRKGSQNLLLMVASVGLLALLVRLPMLGSYLTPDEGLWSQRAAAFVQAVAGRDWAATMTTGHPGVTITWAGAAGMALRTLLDPPPEGTIVTQLAAALAVHPSQADMIGWLRLPIALSTALGIIVIFLLLRRLLPTSVTLLATALLIFDPFLLAHSRVLHMDAVLTMAMTIAWLALLVALRTEQRRFFILAGMAVGIGFLTKATALILGPLIVGWILWRRWSAGGSRAGRPAPRVRMRAVVADLLWIGLPAAAVLVVAWPALWVAPVATLQRVVNFAFALGGVGHELGNFWLGSPTAAPGLLFYPLVLLWRTTPITLIGLMIAAVATIAALAQRQRGSKAVTVAAGHAEEMQTVAALWLYCLWVGLALSFGDKKFDRYLLPIFPVVAILAGWGWIQAWHYFVRPAGPREPARSSRRGVLARLAVATLVVLQAGYALSNLPTYLTAYNPLLGGIRTARQVMLVGWGEGLEQAAAYLNQQPGPATARVAAWYGDNVFGPFYRGSSDDLYYDLRTAAELYANDVGFVVTYLNQMQRGLLDGSIQSQLGQPVMSYGWQGVPLAQVYAWPKPFAHTTDRELVPGLRLQGWTVGPADPAAQQLPVTLYWDATAAAAAPDELAPVAVWLKDAAGEVWAFSEQPVVVSPENQVAGWLDRPTVKQNLALALPMGLLAGVYRVEMAPEMGQGMALGEVDIPATSRAQLGDLGITRTPARVLFGDAVELLGYELQRDNAGWQLDLLWSADTQPPAGVRYFVHVVDASEAIIAQQDGALAALPGQSESSWRAGDVVRQRIHLNPPQSTEAARLAVYVGLYTPDGQRLPLTVGGQPVPDGRYPLP